MTKKLPSHYVRVDAIGRVRLPQNIVKLAGIQGCVSVEHLDNGVMLRPFNPNDQESCSFCGAKNDLITIGENQYVCTVCSKRILKAVDK